MGSHLAVSAVGKRREGGEGSVADRARTHAAAGKPDLALANANLRTHTLILTGDLNRRSAHTLEAEIEHLCEEGVTGITLDLGGLEHIDWTGVAVIAFRCDLCKRRGYDFALIPGAPSIQRAFEQAGVVDSLPFQHDDGIEPVVRARGGMRASTAIGDDRLPQSSVAAAGRQSPD
jgi:anti-anti-sigma factor